MKRIMCLAVVMLAVVNVASADIEWVYINDPGVPGHEGFTGYMSKYETTNAQYCEFLNAALASGDITVSGNDAIGASGSNSGADFVGQLYYWLDGPGETFYGATHGGAARINYSGGVFSVDSGFEGHPVTYDTWYGATAFCNYYGYRLPTEWEWQAVADYDGSYTYGCGPSINNSIANYYGSTHPDGTTVVGDFGTYGYGMCDMAGNVWEWTSSISTDSYRVVRGGCWSNSPGDYDKGSLEVWYRYEDYGYGTTSSGYGYGFRVVASEPGIEALVDIDPDTLNLDSEGKWVTCYIDLPDEYDVRDIDLDSVLLEGLLEIQRGAIQDGVLMVKFDREDLATYLDVVLGVVPPAEGELVVTGNLLDGTPFEGQDTIRVIDEGDGQ